MKTKFTKQEIKESNSMMGWIIALSPLWYIIVIRISQLTLHSNVLKYIPIDIILCIIDRELLKKQDVWKKGKIAWGWCIISPIYFYKRTKDRIIMGFYPYNRRSIFRTCGSFSDIAFC